MFKKIPLDSKILSISHNDLDGIGCQIVLGNVFKNITYINSNFYNLDGKLECVNYDDYDYVFLTDIHPEKKESINISDKIILIDHHPSEFHNPDKLHYVISNKKVCATVLVKYFLENVYNIKLNHLNKFVKYINDYDIWELKYEKSKQLNDLMFFSYKMDDFRKEFMNGRIDFNKKEISFLNELRDKFNKIYDELEIIEYPNIKACCVFEYEFVNEIADKLMKEYDYNIVLIKDIKKGRCSIRGNLKNIDLGSILEKFKWGGGHPMAAGMFVKNNNEFIEKSNKFIQYLYDNYEMIRK